MSSFEDDISTALHELITVDNDRARILQLLAVTRPKLPDSDRLPIVNRLIGHGAYQSFGLVLHRFPKDEEICIQVLKSVAWFARDSESVASMVEHNLPSLLIRILRRHITSPPLVIVSVSILADSSTNMHFQNLVRIHDGIQAIADVISIHKTNVKILDTCFYCLANLSVQSPENISAMVECSCVASIIDGMNRYASEGSLVQAALVVLVNVCRNGSNEQRVVADLNGCRALSTILQSASDPALLKHVFLAIGSFAQGHDNIAVVLDESIVGQMCERLVEHRHSGDNVLEAGIAIFTQLLSNCSERSLIALIDTPMIAIVLFIAKLQFRNASVQAGVLQLFLSLYSRCSRSQIHLLATLRLLSIPVTLSAVYLFPDRGPIASAAITLLGAILTDNNVRCRLEHVDVLLPSIVAVGLHQIADPIALRVVFDVLAEFTTTTAVTSQILIDTQLLDLITYVLAQPDMSTFVHDNALQLLQRLLAYSDVADLVASKLGATLIAMLSVPNLNKATTCPAILAICGDIALSSTGAEIMIQLNILDLALHMLAEESRNPQLVTNILECLRKVIRTSLPARATLKEMGAVKMVEALRFQHSADAKVARSSNDFLHDVDSTTVVSRSKAIGKAMPSVDEFKLPELDQNIRLFLCAGGVLTKHCKRAAPRKRQVFVSTDLRFLVWKEPNKKPRSFFLDNCEKIVSGRSSPELLRESMMFTPASENLSFSVFMKDGRRLSLEAPTEQLRDQWVGSLDSLIRYRQALARLTVKSENNTEEELEKEDNLLG